MSQDPSPGAELDRERRLGFVVRKTWGLSWLGPFSLWDLGNSHDLFVPQFPHLGCGVITAPTSLSGAEKLFPRCEMGSAQRILL